LKDLSGNPDRQLGDNPLEGSQWGDLLARCERLERENALLRQKLDALLRRLFGARSEKIDPAQLLLLLQGNEDTLPPELPRPSDVEPEPLAPRPSHSAPAKGERAPRLPEHLPVVEEVLDPEPVRADPAAWRCIGQEVSEQLDQELRTVKIDRGWF
jgi:transposase